MKSTNLILVLIILLIAGGLFYVASRDDAASESAVTPDDSKMMSEESETMSSDVMVADTDAMVAMESDSMMLDSGTYTTYTADTVSNAEGDVVLFFKATWCPTCRALEKNIEENLSEIPAGVTILEVDYDTAIELRQKYGVTVQHTLVQVDSTGELVAKWTGSPTLTSVLDKLN